MGAAVRLRTVIQYVTCSASARSTWVLKVSCGAPGAGLVGTAVQSMCQVAGHPKVNQRPEAFAARVPVHWVPQIGCVIQPSTGISHTPRLRVPARSTRALGWNTRSPMKALGRVAE